jgi:cardiolipin synthase
MKEKIITIPNAITLCRFLLIPFFIFALVNSKLEVAIMLFATIAMGDALDGISARIMKQKTKMGALFDSVTDWLVILSALITFLIIKKYLSLNLIIVLLIPIIITLLAKSIYVKKKKKTSPTIVGKITIAFAYITTIVLLIGFTYKNVFLTVMVLFAYATMFTYIIKDVKLFIG